MTKRQLTKRQKPTKTAKTNPRSFSRRFEVKPDPSLPYMVEVRIASTRAHMRGEMLRIDGYEDSPRIEGLCRHWCGRQSGKTVARPRGMVARIYLNAQALSKRPSEITSHECGHAAMVWARFRRANLQEMEGEEVMCYALGRLVAQVNRICYAAGAFE